MKKLSYTRPIYIENSKLPGILSYVSPVSISAITIGPFVFSRIELTDTVKNHEAIHWQQYLDCGIILFPILYLFYWFYAMVVYKDSQIAYYMIPFEQEAYCNEHKEFYLITRKRYAWWRFKV